MTASCAQTHCSRLHFARKCSCTVYICFAAFAKLPVSFGRFSRQLLPELMGAKLPTPHEPLANVLCPGPGFRPMYICFTLIQLGLSATETVRNMEINTNQRVTL